MQSQELTASDYFFKLWPWVEANLKRIAYVAAAVAILIFLYFYYSYSHKQREITAGEAYSHLIGSSSASQPDAYLKIAAEYPGTMAGQRALLEGAAVSFTSGKYPEAQAQFQKFLDAYPDNLLTPQALLGVAASLDAQGKSDPAINAYQNATGQSSDINVAASAKFSIARIYETEGKIADAARLYEEVARAYPNSPVSNEAGLRVMELKTKLPAAAKAMPTATTSPFTLTH